MMTRNLGMMASLLVLAACGDKSGAEAGNQATNPPGMVGAAGTGQPTAAPTSVLGEHSFTSIPGNPPEACKGTPGAPVTWTLENVLPGLKDNRRIKREIKRGDDMVDRIPPNEVGKNWPTNLDMDIGITGSDYVMVTMVLKTGATANNPGVYFLRPRNGKLPDGPNPGGTDSSVAVLTPAPKSDEFEYCGRTPIDISVPGTERFSFGVRTAEGVRSLNIGLLVPTKKLGNEDQMWLPIFLDPNVRNEG